MSWNEAQALDQSLLSLDVFFSVPPSIAEILAGGLTNRCWKIVAVDGRAYVWRPASLQAYQFGISRVREQQLLASLQDYHFSPKPILLNEHGLLVEWIEGVSGGDSITPIELLSTLVRIHRVDTHDKPIPIFAYTAVVDSYWHRLASHLKTPPFEALYNRWRIPPSLAPVSSTLCHLDLASYNLVRTEAGIKVIDWEYAAVADPRMELAMTIEIAGLDMPRSVADYCRLRSISDVEPWFIGVNHWRPRNQLMGMLWYLLGYQLKDDESYLASAEQLCEILLARIDLD